YLVQQPLRVVLDSKRSLTGEERIFTLDEHSLWVSGVEATEASVRSLLTELDDDGHVVLDSVLEHLAELGCNQVLVESGANLAGAFVAQDLVDEIHLFMAPIFLGHEARDLIQLPGMTMLSDKKNYRFISAEPVGSDVKLVFRKG
ncbi:MAG: RibD family protein, partial [Gammaproteobacteria bacterium]